MGIGALRRHRGRHQESLPTTSTEPVTPEQLAELRKDPAFEAAYQEELRLAAEKEAADKAAAEQAASEQEAAEKASE